MKCQVKPLDNISKKDFKSALTTVINCTHVLWRFLVLNIVSVMSHNLLLSGHKYVLELREHDIKPLDTTIKKGF